MVQSERGERRTRGEWKRWIVQVYANPMVATGYPLAADRVLTSLHAVEDREVQVRFFRRDREKWFSAVLIWPLTDAGDEIRKLDVAVLEVKNAAAESPLPPGPELDLATGDLWETEGFPRASFETLDGSVVTEPAPLQGKLHSLPDRNAVLSLDVNAHPSDPEGCQGLSGAPVVSRGRLVGVLRRWPAEWDASLQATPLSAVWGLKGFEEAIGPEGLKALLVRLHEDLRPDLDRILRPNAWLRRALGEALQLEVDEDEVSAFAEKLLSKPTLEVANALYRVHHRICDGEITNGDPDVVEQLVLTALPQLDLATEALRTAIAQRVGPCLLLSVQTSVGAELSVARLSARRAYLRAEEDGIIVPTEIPLPESPVIDADGFKEAFRVSLAKKLGIPVEPRERLSKDACLDRDKRLDKRIRARLNVRADALGSDRISYFCLLGHDPRDHTSNKKIRDWLAATYPRLYLIELVGEEGDELDIVEWLHLIFARSRGGG